MLQKTVADENHLESDSGVHGAHLRRMLSGYAVYYHGARTHLSLCKDTPQGRPTQAREQGRVIECDRVGGLHHEYVRVAA